MMYIHTVELNSVDTGADENFSIELQYDMEKRTRATFDEPADGGPTYLGFSILNREALKPETIEFLNDNESFLKSIGPMYEQEAYTSWLVSLVEDIW